MSFFNIVWGSALMKKHCHHKGENAKKNWNWEYQAAERTTKEQKKISQDDDLGYKMVEVNFVYKNIRTDDEKIPHSLIWNLTVDFSNH